MMDNSEVAEKLGVLQADIRHANSRLDDHVIQESRWQDQMIEKLDRQQASLSEIRSLLSEATGARKFLVWLVAVCFAGVALAKGWIWGK